MRSPRVLALALALAPTTISAALPMAARAQAAARAASPAAGAGLSLNDAVSLALSHNRDVIAAKMEIEAAELEVVAARIYPNPTLQYGIANLVLGNANPQMGAVTSSPHVFGQAVQSLGIGEIVDVWSKRSARARAAARGVDQRRFLTEDVLREIVYAVRSAFEDVLRAQAERDMAKEVAARYAETVRLSQARFRAGDIAESELRKVELEGLRNQNAVLDSELQLDVGRHNLAALLGLGAGDLPGDHLIEPDLRSAFDREQLIATALEHRPDLKAAGAAQVAGQARLTAAQREAYPDLTLGATYTHSAFTVSGDNPNSLALTLGLPLPLFDRNQANIGRARLDIRHAENDSARLRLAVENDVTEAVLRAQRSRTLLAVFQRPGADASATATSDPGGMLARAETALKVAEKSYKAGAISLLELLDAQRTYLDTRGQYLRVLHDSRQAAIDVAHAVGE
ncbi:MAG TPA: TolC family protein [Polyangia bacterium]|jgi:cobalt-zinc-cadmium efflux system outer membrane protein|nr:TolC family protein [Polyangia bacterium]